MNRVSTGELARINQEMAKAGVNAVKKRKEQEEQRKKYEAERQKIALEQSRMPNSGGSAWEQYRAAKAAGDVKNASEFIQKRDARNSAWNKIGADTLEDDINALSKSIGAAYGDTLDTSKYYTQEQLNGSANQVKQVRDRLKALQDYYNTYGGTDEQKKAVDDQIKAYDSEIKFFGDTADYYGQFGSAEEYNSRYGNENYAKKYSGLTYSQVPAAINFAESASEKKWLEDNADSFMTSAEAQAEIDKIEKEMNINKITRTLRDTGIITLTGEGSKRLAKLEAIRDSKKNEEELAAYNKYLPEANKFAADRIMQEEIQGDILSSTQQKFDKNRSQGVLYAEPKAEKKNILDPQKLKEAAKAEAELFDGFLHTGKGAFPNTDWMTDEEHKILRYLLYSEGRESGKKYLETLTPTLNARFAASLDETTSNMYDNAGLGGKLILNFGSLGDNLIGGPLAFADNVFNQISGKRVDPNSNAQLFRRIGNTIRQKTGESFANGAKGTIFDFNIFGQNAPNMLYNAVMSSADSVLGASLLGSNYTVTMGMGAAANEAERLYNKGASDSEVFSRGLAAGLAEYITEKVSLDNLIKPKSPANALDMAKEILKQAGIEGSEEMASDVLNLVADSIIMADRSDMSEAIAQYEKGYVDENGTYHEAVSHKEAEKLAWQDFFTDMFADGVAGAMSGGMGATIPTISSYKYSKNRAASQISSIDPGTAEGLASNSRINDVSVLSDVSEFLQNGNLEEAEFTMDEGIAWYEFLNRYGERKYGKNQWAEARTSIDESIKKLKQIKKLVSKGNITAEQINEVLAKADTELAVPVDVTTKNNEKLYSLLAKGELSNKDIERNILKDRQTLAAFERLTGTKADGTTMSQKRASVRQTLDIIKNSTDTLKSAQSAIESGRTASEGRLNAVKILNDAIAANKAENSRLRNSETAKSKETKAAIDRNVREYSFLKTTMNYVRDGGDLSGFTESPEANVSAETGTNTAGNETSSETAKEAVKSRPKNDGTVYASEDGDLIDADTLVRTATSGSVKGSIEDAIDAVDQSIQNINDAVNMTAEEKETALNELTRQKNSLRELADNVSNIDEMARLVHGTEIDKIAKELEKPLKKLGLKIEVENNIEGSGNQKSGAYFDEKTKTVHISRNWGDVETAVHLVVGDDGNLTVNRGHAVSFDRAVTQTIAHEIAHGDPSLVRSFVDAVAGTRFDVFDFRNRLKHNDDSSWKSSNEKAQKNWDSYRNAYLTHEMSRMSDSMTDEAKLAAAEKKVNNDYIYAEIMSDYFGQAIDTIDKNGSAGDNIFVAMNRTQPNVLKRILNAVKRFIARLGGKDNYLAEVQRQQAERLERLITKALGRMTGTEIKKGATGESDGNGKRYSVAGLNSETADRQSLDGAISMYNIGTPMDTIRRRTGWWLGKDGKWRYEISDDKMQFNPDGFVKNPETVGDYVKHDQLFRAYPWIADVKVNMVDKVTGGTEETNGKYSNDGNFIELKNGMPPAKAKYVLAHELQHAVQRSEGFVHGTSPKTGMLYAINLAYDLVKDNPEFVAEKKPQNKMKYLIGYLETKYGGSLGEIAKYYYFKNYGETEARSVSKRLGMSEAERKATPIENNGEIFSYENVFYATIDNLRAMGYNDKQINGILKDGISYDIEQSDVQEPDDKVGKRRRNDRGEIERLSETDTNRGETGEIYRSGEVSTAGVSEKAEVLDSGRQMGELRRGNRGADISNASFGSHSEAQKRLNEASKPEKRFSLSSSTDTVSEMRREETKLTNQIREIEKSAEFKKANDDLNKAINSDNIAEGMKAYQEWRKESGYADLVDRRDTLRADIESAEKNVSGKASAGELAAIEKSGLSEADYFRKQAEKEFGYTPYFYDAGYIVRNGKMLNFSGEKGQHFGSRGEDHRAIDAIYEKTQGTDALVRFMNDGNIRIMAETPGLDIFAKLEPSKEQYATIRRFVNEYADGGYFAIDLSDESGNSVGTLQYEGNINPTRIVNDIKHFYETGEVREQSLDRFRWSLTEANDRYMKAVNDGDEKTAQRLVDEAARENGYGVKLYHGTQNFGFTEIDVSKSDDGISFFAASNPDIAQTYSGKEGAKRISDAAKDVQNLSPSEVIRRLNNESASDGFGMESRYRILKADDVAELNRKIEYEIKNVKREIKRLIAEYADRMAKDFNGDDSVLHGRLVGLLNALENNRMDGASTGLYIIANNTDILGNAAKRRFNELEADIRLKKKLDAKGGVPADGIVVKESLDRYDISLKTIEEARNELQKLADSGNYELYANTDGLLEIDGNGHNWNDIFATLEPNGGNTFHAEYNFGSETLILSDNKGRFAEIPAKSLSDAMPSMAREITKRYGKYFASVVLAQTKDQLKNSSEANVRVRTTGETNTRDIAEFAKEQGYPGVRITNVVDNGGRGANADAGDVYIFFNPQEQVKSADAITYDNDGNVIPLTERFDSGKSDIRYALSANARSEVQLALKDKTVSNEIKLTDTTPTIMLGHDGVKNLPLMMRATHLRENILTKAEAKKRGLPTNAGINYHGLGEKLFLDVIAGLDDVKEAYRGTEKSRDSSRGRNYFLLISKQTDADGNTINIPVFINETGKYNNVFMDMNKVATVFGREQLQEYIRRKLADGSLVRITRRSTQPSEVSSPIEPHYRKSASSIDTSVTQNTPDVNSQSMQNGEKDSSNERHSLVDDPQKSVKSLKKSNEKLQQQIADLKQELKLTHGKKLSRDALLKNIQNLVESYGSTLKADVIYNDVTDLYDAVYNRVVDGKKLKNIDEIPNYVIEEKLDSITDYIIDRAMERDTTFDEYTDLLKELRITKIVVPIESRTDAAVTKKYNDWAEFRKKNFGKVAFANEGVPIDSYYMELTERFPELFPDDITLPGEQAAQIVDVVDTIRDGLKREVPLYGREDTEARDAIKSDVLNMLKNTDRLVTFADKAEQRVQDARLAERMHYGSELAKLKRERNEKIAAIKEHYAEQTANRSEKQKKTVATQQIVRKVNEFTSLLKRPTQKNHVTEAFRKPLLDFLGSLDIVSKEYTAKQKKEIAAGGQVVRDVNLARQSTFDEIQRILLEAERDAQRDAGTNGDEIGETDVNAQEKKYIVDSGILSLMYEWNKNNYGKPLSEMNSEQLKELNTILNMTKSVMSNIKRIYNPTVGLAAKSEVVQDEMKMSRWKDRAERLRVPKKAARWFGETFFRYPAMDAFRFYNLIDSPEFTKQLDSFRRAQDKFGTNVDTFLTMMEDAIGENGIPESWHGKKAKEVTLDLSNGKLRATPAQIMTLYLLLQQEDSRNCLLNERGGAVIGAYTAKGKVTEQKGDKVKKKSVRVFSKQNDPLVLTNSDVSKISEAMTPEMLDCANKISKILSGKAAQLGNEVSMAMWGYKKYTTENYFPMRVYETGKPIVLDPKTEMNLLGISLAQERTHYAGKPLVVEDIFDAVGRHLTNMAQYNAFAQVIDDARRMYTLRTGNGKSLKRLMVAQYGDKADNYYRKLLDDLSGAEITTAQGVEAFSDKLLSNYKAAAVSKNLSVVFKQPMSIFRAMPEFSSAGWKAWHSFKDASPTQVKAEMAEMLEHSGIAKLKNWGASENMTKKSFEELYNNTPKNLLQRANDKLNSGAEFADMWTWSRLWRMSKAEVDATGKYTKGSEAYFNAVNDKFSQVIGKTQVVQSALDSSAAVRNNSLFSKFFYAFQNEPLKQFNYLSSCIDDAVRGKKGAKAKLAKVVGMSVVNAMFTSAISTFFSLMCGTLDRDDDDEKWDDILASFGNNVLMDVLSGGLAPIWQIGETFYSAIESGAYGNTVERMDLASLTDLGGLINKYIISGNGGRFNLGTLQDIINVASELFGWSAKNAIRDVKAFVDRHILDTKVSPRIKYNYLKAWKDVELTDKSAVAKSYYSIVQDAVNRGEYSDYLYIKRDMIYHGYTDTKIRNAVSNSELMDDLYELKQKNPGSYEAKVNNIVDKVSALSKMEGEEFRTVIESAMKKRERANGVMTDDEIRKQKYAELKKEIKERLVYLNDRQRAKLVKELLEKYSEYGFTEADIEKIRLDLVKGK